MKCFFCEENYDPTSEELEAFANADYCWDPANWICPGCEEALSTEYCEETYKDEENYEHPF